jgi:hypothetical protein
MARELLPIACCRSIPARQIGVTIVTLRAAVLALAAACRVRRRSGVPASEQFDRRDKHIADATLGLNERWRVHVRFQLAAQPQHLDVD